MQTLKFRRILILCKKFEELELKLKQIVQKHFIKVGKIFPQIRYQHRASQQVNQVKGLKVPPELISIIDIGSANTKKNSLQAK